MIRSRRVALCLLPAFLTLVLACAQPPHYPAQSTSASEPAAKPTPTSPRTRTGTHVEIHNHTKTEICGVYVSPTDSEDWGDNLLEDTIEAGGVATVGGFVTDDYDLLAVDCSESDDDVIAEVYQVALSGRTYVWHVNWDDEETEAMSPNASWDARTFVETSFFDTECPFEVPEDADVRCGRLVVPENRTKVKSPCIELAVAILSASVSPSQPDPIVYLAGGPGSSALDEFSWDIQAWMDYPFRQDRDLVFVDQRGTGYSLPTLNCPEAEAVDEDAYYDDYDEDPNYLAMEACHDRLVEEGVDLTAYNNAENAADVEALREALGYDEWNLLGISYGTRLGLSVMRDFPEHLRSAVLDSVFPPNVDVPVEDTLNTWNALQTIFDGCAKDPACGKTYPDLEQVLIDTVVALNEQPVAVTITDSDTGEEYDEDVAGDDIVDVVYQAMYDVDLIPLLPRLIYEVADGNFDTYAIVEDYTWGANRGVRPTPRFPRQEPSDVSDSEGFYNSVTCHDDYAFGDYVDAEETAMAGVPEELRGAIWAEADIQFSECAMWEAGRAEAREKEPVVSDVPTLILTGEYDPVTPPRWGKLAAKTLSSSFVFEFPGTGHCTIDSYDCADDLVTQFLANPTVKPDATCLLEVPAPEFSMPDDEITISE